ncbi:MAG: hypothetical protein JST51_19290 [Armatimonadetes bacterium]|nr:hypothetical protein [Armatimonadota bacterium]
MYDDREVSAIGWTGCLSLIIGCLLMCGGGIYGFGDRDPNPTPESVKEFKEQDRIHNILWTCGGFVILAGAIAAAVSIGQNRQMWKG